MTKKKRLAIISTHPIQYNAPWFAMLHKRENCHLTVFYTWPQAIEGFNDPDFKQKVQWDIPLLDGYNYELVDNISQHPSSKRWSGIDNPTLIKNVKDYTPDAILIFGWKLKSHFQVMRHFKGKVPIWFRGDSTLLDHDIQTISQLFNSSTHQLPIVIGINTTKQLLKFKIRQFTLKYVYRHIDKAFYVGTNSKKYFQVHGLKDHQLVLAPHAIDNHRFTGIDKNEYENKAKQWRKDLGIKPEDKVVLFAGKLESKKNPLLLLNAIQQLNSQSLSRSAIQPIKLIFIGSGPLEKKLKHLSQGDPNIFFIPFVNQSQMPVAYRLGNIFCLPSKGPEETWGLAVNEALASGRPVLVSDKVGCAVDIVTSGVGRIFKSNTKNELLACLNELLQSNIQPDTCQNHIANWSFEAICQSMESELSEL
ncbi:glycosyltransferase family 4 protein [Carboxylicivirga caseinilyticus]|uniref:glycosyltransferase family 4 protein n=1 Tax=Carboxylicivirga caseinilyticus TaxID=3417572 RepID=UPI003D348376|nr:glycosyltransferase family 4 protein [Marinilabiliaceae bacterium A049]